MNEDIKRMFYSEADNILNSLRDIVSKSLKEFSEEYINEAYRLIHTLKGAAGFVGMDDLVYICHKWEDALNLIRSTKKYKEFIPTLASAVEEINEVFTTSYSEDTFIISSGNLIEIEKSLLETIEDISAGRRENVERKLRYIYNRMVSLRTRPLNDVFRKVRMGLGDLLSKTGKKAILQTFGGNITVEVDILRKVETIIIHLVRNAIDHGIEYPEERIRKGKSEYGLVNISASQEGSYLRITVSDDGKGIDLDALRSKADEMGLKYKDPLELIFVKGFSSLREATELSGRGFGMDIVLEEARSLGGWVDVHTEKDKGTEVSVYVMAGLWGGRYLFCIVKGFGVAISIDYVHNVIPLEDVVKGGDGYKYRFGETLIPVLEYHEDAKFGIFLVKNSKGLIIAADDVVGVGTGTFHPMDFSNENFAGFVIDEGGSVYIMPNLIKVFMGV